MYRLFLEIWPQLNFFARYVHVIMTSSYFILAFSSSEVHDYTANVWLACVHLEYSRLQIPRLMLLFHWIADYLFCWYNTLWKASGFSTLSAWFIFGKPQGQYKSEIGPSPIIY